MREPVVIIILMSDFFFLHTVSFSTHVLYITIYVQTSGVCACVCVCMCVVTCFHVWCGPKGGKVNQGSVLRYSCHEVVFELVFAKQLCDYIFFWGGGGGGGANGIYV